MHQSVIVLFVWFSEERVVPLEVSRSKLSRHLEGLVFRCHKCTFTCSSEQNLQQHIQKHEELKPYQCQLCYYDSKLLHELEIHLQQEHKVCLPSCLIFLWLVLEPVTQSNPSSAGDP